MIEIDDVAIELKLIVPLCITLTVFCVAVRRRRQLVAKRGRQLSDVNWIPAIISAPYLASSIAAFFVDAPLWYPYFDEASYTMQSFVLYGVLVGLALLPALFVRPLANLTDLGDAGRLQKLSVVMVVLGLFSFVYQAPYAVDAVVRGAYVVRAAMNAEGTYLLPESPMTTLAVAVSAFHPMFLVLLYVAILQGWRRWYRWGLVIGATSYLVSGLCFATRDVFVFFPITLAYVHALFLNVMPQRVRKRGWRRLVLLGAVAAGVVSLLTVDRFFSEDRDYLAWGTVGYLGSQPFTFAETVAVQREFYNGGLRFPVIVAIANGGVEPTVTRRYNYETMFGTFLKDLYADGGWWLLWITIGLGVPVACFLLKATSARPTRVPSHVLLSILCAQTLTQGVFYYTLGSRSGNIYTMIMVVLAGVLLVRGVRRVA